MMVILREYHQYLVSSNRFWVDDISEIFLFYKGNERLYKLCGPWYMTAVYNTVELQWLDYLWNHENMFETGVVRANEC